MDDNQEVSNSSHAVASRGTILQSPPPAIRPRGHHPHLGRGDGSGGTAPSTNVSAAAATHSLILSNSSWPQSTSPLTSCVTTKHIEQNTLNSYRVNSLSSPATTYTHSATNNINDFDALFTNKTNLTSQINLTSDDFVQIFREDGRRGKTKKELSNVVTVPSSENSTKECSRSSSTICLNELLNSRKKWESFDSSPPHSFSNSVSPNSEFPPFPSFPLSHSTHSSTSRSKSPISAFLDSCLTPRLEEDDTEPKFAFIGCLSGEGRILKNLATPKLLEATSTRNANGENFTFFNESTCNGKLADISSSTNSTGGPFASQSSKAQPPEAVR